MAKFSSSTCNILSIGFYFGSQWKHNETLKDSVETRMARQFFLLEMLFWLPLILAYPLPGLIEVEETLERSFVSTHLSLEPRSPILPFPAAISQITMLNNRLSGSTGARLVSYNGGKFVMKSTATRLIGREHLEEEHLANQLYAAMGVHVPSAKLYTHNGELVRLSSFLENTRPVKLSDAHEIQKGFIADAFLANWDVLGLEADNTLIYMDRAYRIDAGGALRMRAQGQAKGNAFGNNVGEIFSMRCLSFPNSPFCEYFKGMNDAEVKAQIVAFVPKARAAIDHFVKDPQLKATLDARLESLKRWAN